jgi:DNA-binding ferritin-like protein (Dps family)
MLLNITLLQLLVAKTKFHKQIYLKFVKNGFRSFSSFLLKFGFSKRISFIIINYIMDIIEIQNIAKKEIKEIIKILDTSENGINESSVNKKNKKFWLKRISYN